jgi:hypothetical protein
MGIFLVNASSRCVVKGNPNAHNYQRRGGFPVSGVFYNSLTKKGKVVSCSEVAPDQKSWDGIDKSNGVSLYFSDTVRKLHPWYPRASHDINIDDPTGYHLSSWYVTMFPPFLELFISFFIFYG